MKPLIKTDYQYFLIPLTYFAVWFASVINYFYYGMPLKIIKVTIIAILVWLTLIMLLPLYIEELLNWHFVNSAVFYWASIYIVSIPTSIYFIKEQRRNNIK